MPLILHIDTATGNAIISIAENEHVIDFSTNNNQKEHASFLQPAVKQLLANNNISLKHLDAISVTAGPGSYTGLRVGMASAKGLCYALQIPMIALDSLNVMAFSTIENTIGPAAYLYCPMIDAGRMEVFTALLDNRLNEIIPPCALILQPASFADFSGKGQIIFFGSGAKKFETLSSNPNFLFKNTIPTASAQAKLAIEMFRQNTFADANNAEPVYIKQFYTIDEPKKP